MDVFRKSVLVAATLPCLLLASTATAEPQGELQRNPFSRPAIADLPASDARANSGLSARHDSGLRAVLVAGRNSVANIGGVILQVGECAGPYCLVAVTEEKARITQNGKEVVLSLYEPEQGEEQ